MYWIIGNCKCHGNLIYYISTLWSSWRCWNDWDFENVMNKSNDNDEVESVFSIKAFILFPLWKQVEWEVRGDTDTLQIISCCPAVTWQCPCGSKRQCTLALDQWAWLYGCFSSTLASYTEYVYRNVAKRKFWLSDLLFIQNLIWRYNKESF